MNFGESLKQNMNNYIKETNEEFRVFADSLICEIIDLILSGKPIIELNLYKKDKDNFDEYMNRVDNKSLLHDWAEENDLKLRIRLRSGGFFTSDYLVISVEPK